MTTLQTSPATAPDQLAARWRDYQAEHRRAFMYDAAREFGVSELELLATNCGDTVTRLEADWAVFLEELHRCGKVMALTRNHWAVIEKKGYYKPVTINGPMGVVLDEGLDLRLFMRHWAHGYAVHYPNAKRMNRSFHFFDADGTAVHKVYVGDEGAEAFEELTRRYASADQSREQQVKPPAAAEAVLPDAEIDAEGLRKAWADLRDTHEFFGMLKRFNVGRTQAFRLVGAAFAEPLARDSYRTLFERAAENKTPIMVFVDSPGCIEIHSGPINKLIPMEGWFNIMDPGFNLHLREAGVHAVWRVRKPTTDGVVTSVELYDETGKEIAMLFGKRKPGIPELETWRDLAESLPCDLGSPGSA